MKKCTICGIEKPLSEYTPRKDRPCGYDGRCKECNRKRGEKIRHTKNGLVSLIIRSQRKASKARGHEMPTYTLDELKSWVFSQPNFETLFNEWVASGFNRWKKPSIDRIDEKLSYNFRNIRLVTWRENIEPELTQKKLKNIKQLKPHIYIVAKLYFFVLCRLLNAILEPKGYQLIRAV